MKLQPKKSKTLKTIIKPKITFSFLLALSLVGCGGKQAQNLNRDPLELAHQDLQALDHFDAQSAAAYDRTANFRFSEIFGGYSGTHVRNFFNQRIQYIVRIEDILDLTPKELIHKGWLKVPSRPEEKGVAVVASNLVGYWLQGLVDNTIFTLRLKNGRNIEITSRPGIMKLGVGYSEGVRQIVRQLRQSTLVHEARHSDCNGGVTQADLQEMRNASSYEQFFSQSQIRKCGHFHSICKRGDLKGLLGCDAETWGSYGIETIFLKAALAGTQPGSIEWEILNAASIDTEERLEFDFNEVIHNTTDHPDLTHLGLLD